MVTIRPYSETDAVAVGRLIAETYARYNLTFAEPEALSRLLGPFQHAWSTEGSHRADIASVLRSLVVLVAEEDGEIVGVLRGRRERLASLFVRGDRHRRGIGRRLVTAFEESSRRDGVTMIRVAATLYAIPF
jgi:predicted N-acetyltransferase YhbS